jgi:hypothetical protein
MASALGLNLPQNECPICHHPPIRHVSDVIGNTCLVCIWMLKEGQIRPEGVCTRKFNFKLPLQERIQAASAARDSYEPRRVCVNCACTWEQHWGFLCPNGDSVFVPLLDKDLPYLHKSDIEN